MSGKRHHFLPRFLLRGFLSRPEGPSELTWYFRSGAMPKEVGIKSVGVEENFYKNPEDETLDDEITRREGEQATLLRDLRATGSISPGMIPSISEFVFHMALRPRYLRSFWAELGPRMTALTTALFSTPENCETILRNHIDTNPLFFHKLLEGPLLKFNPRATKDDLELAVGKLRTLLPNLIPILKEQMPDLARTIGPEIAKEMPKWTRNAHLQSLSMMVDEDDQSVRDRTKMYERFRWEVRNARTGEYIIGDIGPVAFHQKRRHFVPAWVDVDDQLAIILPISSTQLLVGARDGDFPSHVLEPDALNPELARMSWDFFISNARTPHAEKLLETIGVGIRKWTEATLVEMEEELRQELLKR